MSDAAQVYNARIYTLAKPSSYYPSLQQPLSYCVFQTSLKRDLEDRCLPIFRFAETDLYISRDNRKFLDTFESGGDVGFSSFSNTGDHVRAIVEVIPTVLVIGAWVLAVNLG